jgi:hypothetical protein
VRVDTSNSGTVRIYDSDGSLLATPASPTTLPSSGFDLAIDEGDGMLYVSNQSNGTNFRRIDLSDGTNTQLEAGQGIAVDPDANSGAGYLWSGYSNSSLIRYNLAMTASTTVGTNIFNIQRVSVDSVLEKVYIVAAGAGSTWHGLHVGNYGGPFSRIVSTSSGRSVEEDPTTGYNYFLNSSTLYEVVDGIATPVWTVPITATYVAVYQALVDSEAGYAYVFGQQSSDNNHVFDRYDWPSMTGRTTLLSVIEGISDERFILYPY